MIIETEKYYNETDDVLMEYYKDIDGIWYNYESVSLLLNYEGQIKNNIYNNEIIKENKRDSYELKYIDLRGNERIMPAKFVNSVALFELIARNIERNYKVKRTALEIERRNGMIINEDVNDHALKINLNLLKNELESEEQNYDRLYAFSKEIYNSPTIQYIVNKPECFGEQAKIRHELIKAFDEDRLEEFTIIKPTLLVDDEDDSDKEMRLNKKPKEKIVYKRNKNHDSTCPSWIKNVVK